jgi:hypothetical protein
MQVRGTIRKIALSALLIGATGALSACVVNDGYSGGGYDDYDDDYYDYPPARPRHGYRYAYPGGLSLIYDSGLGLYSIYGYPDAYFYNGYFYRWDRGYWNRARHWNRGWERCDSRRWPRPIYHVHNNYYRQGRRPHHDWGNRDWDRDRDRDWDRDHRDRKDRDYVDRVRDAQEDARRRERYEDTRRVRAEQQREEARERAERERVERRGDGYVNRVRDAQQDAKRREEERKREVSEELRQRSRESDPVDHLRRPDSQQQRVQRQRAALPDVAAARRAESNQRQAIQQAVREQQRAEKAARQERRRDSAENEGGERSEPVRRGNAQERRGDRR